MPRQSVFFAGGIIGLAAAVGAYIGLSRSLSPSAAQSEEQGVVVAPVTPVASAKPILTPQPSLDEADVRRMAREEAQAVLARSQAKKAQDDDADDSAPDQLTPVTPPAAPTPAKPATAATPPPT